MSQRQDNRNGPFQRAEFERYTRVHESDPFAHAAMMNRILQEGLSLRVAFDNRLSALERWQQRIIGGMAVIVVLLGAGVITLVVDLLRRTA